MRLGLSPAQSQALARAVASGGLRRAPGGFWVPLDAPPERDLEVAGGLATWWCGTLTIRALERRGLLKQQPGPKLVAIPTEAGAARVRKVPEASR